MIVKLNKMFEQNSVYPNTDWLGENNFIIDETTPQGQEMADTYMANYPFIDFEHDGEYVTKVIILDKPVKPPEIEGKEIKLVKNEVGQWVYVYEDVPLTEVGILKKELEEQKALINAILGVTE